MRQPESIDDLMPPQIVLLFAEIVRKFQAAGITDAGKRVWEFFLSDQVLSLPFVQISSALYASMANKARHKKGPPTQGFATDVDTMANLLPYCDAMFMDKEIAGLWRDVQGSPRHRSAFQTRVFSLQSKADFLAYLNELDMTVPAEQRGHSDQVFG